MEDVTLGGNNDYLDLATSGPNWQALCECLARIGSAVNKDPAARTWLASSVGMDGLQDVFRNPAKYFAVAAQFLNKDGSVDHWTEASTDDVPGYRAIVNYSAFSANSPAYNWDTILHELAHVLDCEGFNQNDGGEDEAARKAAAWNAELLARHCRGAINQAT